MVHRTWLRFFKTNTCLQELYLGGNFIGDIGAEEFLSKAMKVNSSLKILDLGCCCISYNGAEHLSEALKVNTSVMSLSLSGNHIGNNGASYISKALVLNGSLRVLNLSNTDIGAEGAEHLTQALQANSGLTSLDLCTNPIGSSHALHSKRKREPNGLFRHCGLKSLDLSGCYIMAKSLDLHANSSPTCLYLGGNCVDKDDVALVRGSEGQRQLDEPGPRWELHWLQQRRMVFVQGFQNQRQPDMPKAQQQWY